MAALLTLPLFMLLIHPLISRLAGKWGPRTVWVVFLASCLGLVGLTFWGGRGDDFLYWRGSLAYTHPLLFLIAVFICQELPWNWPRLAARPGARQALAAARDWCLTAAVALFIVVSMVLRIFPASDPYVADNHCEAVLFATAQVSMGKTMLVDAPHQYGLYPEFVAPVFRLVGGINVLKFTAVMAVLQLAVFGLWTIALLRVMQRRWLALLTFLGTFLFFSSLIPQVLSTMGMLPSERPFAFGSKNRSSRLRSSEILRLLPKVPAVICGSCGVEKTAKQCRSRRNVELF